MFLLLASVIAGALMPAYPLKNPNVKPYTGPGYGVLAPGVVVGPEGYTGPSSIVGNFHGYYTTPVQQIEEGK